MKGNKFMFHKILSTFALTGLMLTVAVSYFSISHRLHGFPITYRVHDYVVEIYGGHIHWYPTITDTRNLPRHHVPLWIPALPFIVLFYFAHKPIYRNHRRKILGLCLHCGYDLRASSEGCPECGSEVPGAFVSPRMRVPEEKLREPHRIAVEEATAGRSELIEMSRVGIAHQLEFPKRRPVSPP